MTMLETPMESVAAYVDFLSSCDIPVLRRTVRELDALRDDRDRVNGKRISAVVLGDPLMAIKLLAHLQANRRASQNHDITTIDRAIMMMGVMPFLDTFDDMPTLEEQLAAHPKALLGALHVIGQSRKAAHFARDWAIARHDLDVNEITVAALLHETAKILCWTFAPRLTLRVENIQRMDTHLRSTVAEHSIFGVTTADMQLGLIRAWNLPELLVTLLDDDSSDNPRIQNVRLASRFTRHLASGWDNPALPDDITDIGKLLRLGREALLKRLGAPPDYAARFVAADT